jgi:hypothetical protein
MLSMATVLLNLFKTNEGINYDIIIPLAIGYVLIFWLVVSGWVLYDAKKRYKNRKIIWAIFVLNVVFGIPFFLLYLLFRPDSEEIFAGGITESEGGVNVPLVNFVGKEGVVMSFQLKINSEKLSPTEESEMKIDINFATDDANKQLLPARSEVKVDNIDVKTETTVVKKKENPVTKLGQQIKNNWGNFTARFARKPKEEKSGPAKTEEKKEDKQTEDMVQRFLNDRKNKKKKKK